MLKKTNGRYILLHYLTFDQLTYYTDRYVLLMRENISVSIYIALHMLDNEHTIRKVTLPLANWSIIQIVSFYEEKEH